MGAPLTASTASRGKKKEGLEEEFDDTPIHIALISWLSYLFLVFFGHLRDFMVSVGLEKSRSLAESPKLASFTPLFRDFESFYTRSMYRRICDAWNRPICSVPGAKVTLMERESKDYNWTFYFTGERKEYHNLGSYNYLGFAENKGECCEAACAAIDKYGTSTCSPRYDLGTYAIHNELEKLVARFVGREDAITFGMGFATNAGNIPTLVDKNCLIISDELNHASLVLGCRLSGAKIKVFKHNDMDDLESILRSSIIEGQPRTHRPWKRILICIEGIYSMEGSMANLPEIIKLKKKYKAYLYLDEAHSIGAIGQTGRGVCEHFGVDVNDIDILMGTFTKSFGSAGGYIAGDKALINHIRAHSHAHLYSTAISAAVAQQVITSMKIIMGEQGGSQGAERLRQLADNSLYFRRRMKDMGFIIYGNDASPVVPMLIFVPCKICAFSREMKKRGVLVVVVGYPATPVLGARSRFCLSAAHTRKDLDEMLEIISEVGDVLGLKYLRGKKKAITSS